MIGSLFYVLLSSPDFLTVLEGKPAVVFGVDRGVVHQPVPAFALTVANLRGKCVDAAVIILTTATFGPFTQENGYRYYEAGQMAQLHRIIALKNMGFSIDDIRKIVGGAEEKSFLLEKKQEILKEIAVLTTKLSQVESYLARESINLSAPVLIKEIPEAIICTMEQRIKSYDALFEFMPQMGAQMEILESLI